MKLDSPLVQTALSWVSLLGGERGVARVMKARGFRPCPIEGPDVGRCCRIHAIGADRNGVCMLDSGGTVHWVEWDQIRTEKS